MHDKDKFKQSLIPYLQAKGIDVSRNPIFCFNPDHSNSNSEAMSVYEDRFKCFGSCGISGDVYDACRILTGLADFNEQFLEVERTILGFNESGIKQIKKPKALIEKVHVKAVEKLLISHGGRKKYVESFLAERGYNPQLIEKIKKNYGYWPGRDEALKTFNELTLQKAGIPEKSWYHSGVVIKLASGFKLMWYGKDNENKYGCQKRNSISSKTFPSPYSKDDLSGDVIITEAETSAVSMRGSGFSNIYSSGSVQAITKYNAEAFENCDSVTLAFDGDQAGRYFSGLISEITDKKTGKKTTPKTTVQKIFAAGFTGKVFAANMPDDKDPDDLIREDKIEELKEILKNKTEMFSEEAADKPKKKNVPKKKKKKKETETEDDSPFRFLGFDDRYYYILPKNQQIPLSIGRGDSSIKNYLFEIAEKSWWIKNFNREEDRDGVTKIIFQRDNALSWFRNESYKVGIYDDSKIKGVGVHKDNEEIILNTGTQLKTVSEKTITFDKWDGENVYIKSKRVLNISGTPWTLEEGRYLWEQINTFSFEKKLDSLCVLGFMTISPFSGVLFRRPSLWITAAPRTGKSHLMEELITPAIGGENYSLVTEGLSSEAYIRQNLKKDAIPVIIDEFEAQNKKENMLIKSVIKLVRSSFGGKSSGKGSTSHDPIEFRLHSMFCFGSVNVTIDNDADKSRIHICRLLPSKGICKPPKDFQGMRVRTFKNMGKILSDIDICKDIITNTLKLPNRVADTYSPFLCGAWNVISDDVFLQDKSNNIIRYFSEAMEELLCKESEADEDKIIHRILEERIKIDTQNELTIAEMLTKTMEDIADNTDMNFNNIRSSSNYKNIIHDEGIQRYGIRRYKDKDNREVIAFSRDSSELSRILSNTPFSDYKEILQRNDLVIEKSRNVRIAGMAGRCIVLDWSRFERKYIGNNEENK